MQNNIKESIIKTLSYSDVFDYPLNKSEVYKYYIGERTEEEKVYFMLEEMAKEGVISKKDDFYFLNGRQNLVLLRKERESISFKKWTLAKKIAKILGLIPTIKLIGISGSLSMNNCELRDDVDLFIITKAGSLWSTRFLVSILLILLGKKRSRNDSFGINMVCPNMFLSENSLGIKQNIFTAHEISQLKTIVSKNGTYEKFINENAWVLNFMPNAFKVGLASGKSENHSFNFLDNIFYKIQYFYMKKRITTEKISREFALFHPKDKTAFATELYETKFTSYIAYLSTFDQDLEYDHSGVH